MIMTPTLLLPVLGKSLEIERNDQHYNKYLSFVDIDDNPYDSDEEY